MEREELFNRIQATERDRRINAWHIALLVAMYVAAAKQDRCKQIKVKRSEIMALAHIGTLPTYHKYINELQDLGYIVYRPSYHPGIRTEIDLM